MKKLRIVKEVGGMRYIAKPFSVEISEGGRGWSWYGSYRTLADAERHMKMDKAILAEREAAKEATQ